MDKLRRMTLKCPKCNGDHTYDIVPEIRNEPELQLQNLEFFQEAYSLGNARYYCIDCDYKWKKYRGKKPYEKIKVIYSDVGGYPGPYHEVKVDFVEKRVEHKTAFPFDDGLLVPVNNSRDMDKEDIELFLTELYKCDFVNWAEEYQVFGTVCDGTHWSVRIEYDTHCEIKIGNNHFPPKWTKFCKAISKLSGNEFF